MVTGHGWAALVAAAAAVVVGRLFGLLELYVLGAGLAATVVVAWISVTRRLPELHVARRARPDTVTVGEPARVDLRVANGGRRRSPRLRLWEPVGGRGGAPMQLAPLAPGDAVTAAYRVPTGARGIVRTGPLQVERTDPLGLCRRSTTLAGTGEVVVMPERVPLAFPGLSSNGRLGEHLRTKALGRSGNEFHSQREYVPGDDLRRINWKSSARTGTLIVREPALEGVHRCTVVLDTLRAGYDDDGFERAVSAAASLVTAAAHAGATTRIVAPGLDLRGPDVAHDALRWLATITPGDEIVDPATAGRTHSDGLGLLVLVTSSPASAACASTRNATSPDEALVLVATMSGAEGARFGVEATSLQQLERGWNRLVGGHGAVSA